MIKLLLLSFLISLEAHALIAQASLFPEMKSINPGVIGKRAKGQISFTGVYDNIEKEMTLLQSAGHSSDGTSDIAVEIQSFNFFRGGKGGGFMTTEFDAIQSTGDRTVSLAYGDQVSSDVNEVSFRFIQFAFSLGKIIGISLANVSYEFSSNYNVDYGSTTYSEDFKATISGNLLRIGSSIKLGVVDFGFYGEAGLVDINTESQQSETSPVAPQDDGSGSSVQAIVGVGFGFSGKNSHFEVSYEMPPSGGEDPDPNAADQTTYSPVRIMGTMEFKFGKWILGYTGKLYKGGFTDLEKSVFNQLAYSNAQAETRLEHVFNFTIAAAKGLSFGISGNYSSLDLEEENPMIPGIKNATTSTQYGAMAKIGYTW